MSLMEKQKNLMGWKIRDFEDDFPVSSLEKGSCGFNCVPFEDVDIQIPGTCGCDLIWKWNLCRCNQAKMRSYLIRVNLNPA